MTVRLPGVLTIAFPAAAFATNCYVVATGPGQECLIVDPGIGVADTVAAVLAEHRLKPAAVLLTHGHLDHVYSVTPVCGGETAAYIHPDDRYRLDDPLAQSSPDLVAMLEQQFGERATWREPEHVVHLKDRQRLALAGLAVEVLHAPGHTEGSVMFALDGVPDSLRGTGDEAGRPTTTVLTGDVLFRGSIGRTDLPGGSHPAMLRSLRDVVLPLDDTTLLLPGHGPATTMAQERGSNPYLRELAS